MKRSQRGFTFVEMSLVMGLTFSLLALVSLYFTRGQRYAGETRAYSEAQGAATTLLRRMSDKLYHCSHKHRQIVPGCAFFLSYVPLNAEQVQLEMSHSGQIAWKKWLGYYYNSEQKRVLQGEQALASDHFNLEHAPLPLIDVANIRLDPTVKWTPLPGAVRNFSIQTSDHRVKIRLTTESFAPITGTEAQREVTVTVAGEVALYN